MAEAFMTERDLIQQIHQLVSQEGNGLVQGIGDDCAVVEKDEQNVWLLTMDTLMESVHFDCSWHPPYLLGRKAVSVNVSDVAAMGGRPVFALLSLGLPADFSPEWVTELNRGINEACGQYGCLLIGGDTVCSLGKIALTLTLIGETSRDQVLYRHGAKTGDTVWVSGALGLAAAGLDYFRSGKTLSMQAEYPVEIRPCIKAHLDPEARVGLAGALSRTGLVHAMMDLSDGLSTDLSHLCQQSHLAAMIEEERFPGKEALASAASSLGFSEKERTGWMIAGGEDYELLFTASPENQQAIQKAALEHGVPVTPIGQLREGQGVILRRKTADGYEEELISFQGFDHFVKS
ncbi:MAG: thiamine-phosphate kinase [Candidatus Electrothrix scaldis]|nr:MAG: thiamine-phosphate kinase [Candidatus Electrothrix sp. GW3-3]